MALSNQLLNKNTDEIQSDLLQCSLLQCSDILLNNASFKGFGHNEDGWNSTMNYGYYSHYKITNGTENEFFAFQYPGTTFPAYGVNIYGVSVSENAAFPTNVTIPARGIFFLLRAVIDAKSLSDAIDIINNYTRNGPVCSYGGSFSIGYMDNNNNKEINIANVEVSNYNVSFAYYGVDKDESYGYHFNEYLRLNVSQQNDESSIHRLNRTKQLIEENGLNTMQDIKNILGDTEDTQYPLYRTNSPPDNAATLTTGIFDIENQALYVYEKCNPKLCQPTLTVSFDLTNFKVSANDPSICV